MVSTGIAATTKYYLHVGFIRRHLRSNIFVWIKWSMAVVDAYVNLIRWFYSWIFIAISLFWNHTPALCLKISRSLREVFIVSYYIFDYGPWRFQEYLVKSCRWKYRNCPIKLSCYFNPIKLASYKIQSIGSKSID